MNYRKQETRITLIVIKHLTRIPLNFMHTCIQSKINGATIQSISAVFSVGARFSFVFRDQGDSGNRQLAAGLEGTRTIRLKVLLSWYSIIIEFTKNATNLCHYK